MPTPKNRSSTRRTRPPDALGIYVLRVSLRYIEPAIWREISVPESYTLEQLHRVLQCAFAWMDYHLHEFQVGRTRYVVQGTDIQGLDPAQATLGSLGLTRGSRFLYVYDYGDGWEHEIEVLDKAHEIVDPRAIPMPRVLGGQRAAPPEDCGGPPGYAQLCEVLADPAHPEHAHLREWVPRGFDPTVFDLPSVDHGLVLACAWGAI
jgi:hypothetical protein